MTREALRFPEAAVVSPHYLASAAGARVLAQGGNAVDACVAANLALAVVAPYLCGFGGDLLAVVWDGDLHGYRGVGRAPGGATIEGVRSRCESPVMPALGPHSVTVPGAVDGWFALLDRWGSKSFGDLAADALRYTAGFPLTRRGAFLLDASLTLYPHRAELRGVYDGHEAGSVLRQPALARTIRLLADAGPDAYYRGPIGATIAEHLQAGGAFLSADDLAAHAGAWVEPLRAPFRDVDVAELPPPTQGVTALEMLRIVDGLDLPPDGPDRQHLLIEAAKAALADRDEQVGDPDAMVVEPGQMLSDPWVSNRRAAIDPHRASRPAPRPGPDGGTAYLCAADGEGLLVSLIQSNFTAFGSGVHVPEWGINLQNRGSSFHLDERRVNALGPNRLPMHTLVPAMGFRDGRPWLVFGTMGGHGQAQTHLQVLTRLVVDGDDPQQGVAAPRWAVDPGTTVVAAESRFPAPWLDDLGRRGHHVRVAAPFDDHMGHAHAIECAGPGYRAATDPRTEGAALGH